MRSCWHNAPSVKAMDPIVEGYKNKVKYETVSLKWSKNLYHIKRFNFVLTEGSLRPFLLFKTFCIFQLHTFYSCKNILIYFLDDYGMKLYLRYRIIKVARVMPGAQLVLSIWLCSCALSHALFLSLSHKYKTKQKKLPERLKVTNTSILFKKIFSDSSILISLYSKTQSSLETAHLNSCR